ncbi:enoyl-CoA hydratase-related protein [Streptomyces sp. NPDC091292]|uniref:enoyl-CoA hydratase-related protein n=1 Tax=Streptomyces sp. NPDC091292 TaxID=3365991 RepID=UPI00380A0C81
MTVTYRRDDAIAWLTIERPEALNVLSHDVRRGLFDGFARYADDSAAAVLILTGEGDRAFCAGGDLKEMAEDGLLVPPPDYVPQLGRNITVDKPVIAAVNGIAYGGGFMLVQNCDLAVAAEHARFAIAEAKVGRGAPWAVPLTRIVGRRIAAQLLMTGDPIDARRAYELGLVNEVVPACELRAAAARLARTIAGNAPLSVRAAKQTVLLDPALALDDAFAAAERLWEPVYLSDDARNGPRAFAEKRTPQWKGH